MKMTVMFALFFIIGTAVAKAVHGDSVVGTWRLVAYEDRPAQGPSRFPYGETPQGLLVYDAHGHMSLQIMKTPHPKVASSNDEKITAAEKVALFDSYTAYYGKYWVDEDRRVVTHHVEADMADVYIGRDEERPYEVHNGRLTLKPKWTVNGKTWEGVRVFERIGD